MQQINELSNILNQHFKWNKAKMDCFCGMLIGLIKVRSINLTKIANAYPSKAEPDSRYRRMQRFIHDYPINFDTVAWFIMKRFNFDNQPFYLILDRTNWQWGEMDINILVLALAYKGVAIPIYWLPVFPYAVLYTIESDYVLIIAVMHCHRKPDYWHSRLM
jgi:hypothetical protein